MTWRFDSGHNGDMPPDNNKRIHACRTARSALGDNGPMVVQQSLEAFRQHPEMQKLAALIQELNLDPGNEVVELTAKAIVATRVYEADANRATLALPCFEKAQARYEQLSGQLARAEVRAVDPQQAARIAQAMDFTADAAVALEKISQLINDQKRTR